MDSVLVFDRSGRFLEDMGAYKAPRSWVVNRIGTAKITLPVDDDKATETNLKFNNRVLIENDKLANWIGVIQTPEHTTPANGIHSIYLEGLESVFWQRVTNLDTVLSGTPGAIFRALVSLANSAEDTGIDEGSITDEGETFTDIEYSNVLIGDAMNDIATRANMIWYVTGQLSAGTLTALVHFVKKRGTVYTTRLTEWDGGNFVIYDCALDGQLANQIIAAARGESIEEIPSYTANDSTSRGKYGLIQKPLMASDTEDAGTAEAIAKEELAKSAEAKINIRGDIMGDVDSYPQIGDTVYVNTHSLGIRNLTNYPMIVYSLGYDPDSSYDPVSVKLVEEIE